MMAFAPNSQVNTSYSKDVRCEVVETDHGVVMVALTEGKIGQTIFMPTDAFARFAAEVASVASPKLRLVPNGDKVAREVVAAGAAVVGRIG